MLPFAVLLGHTQHTLREQKTGAMVVVLLLFRKKVCCYILCVVV